MLLPPGELARLEVIGAYSNNIEVEDSVLDMISCADADASVYEDRVAIRKMMHDACGFEVLDIIVRERLRRFFRGLSTGWLSLLPASVTATPRKSSNSTLSSTYERPVTNNPDYQSRAASVRACPHVRRGDCR